MDERQRLLWIDALKAFAISLVIVGHCLQFIGDQGLLYRYIYAFHMPLFMTISGFCSYKPFVSFVSVKKRFFQLVIPFLAWPVVWYLLKMDFSGVVEYYLHLPLYPDTGLWFLFTLFLITLVDFCRSELLINMLRISSLKYVYECSVLLFTFILLLFFALYKYNALPGNWLNFVALYYPYYMIGCVMRKYKNWLDNHLLYIGSMGGVFYLCATSYLQSLIYQPILAVSGILGAFFIFQKYFDRNMPRLIVFTGSITLGIYAVHQPIIYKVKDVIEIPLWADILLTFVLTYTISIAVVRILKIFRVTRFLFLGLDK